MANIYDPGGDVQPTGYLSPILVDFLNSLPNPNIVIQQHPAFPILVQSHPNPTIAATANPTTGFTANTPGSSGALTSASGLQATTSAPKAPSTASGGTAIGNPSVGFTANTPGSSGGLTSTTTAPAPATNTRPPTPGIPSTPVGQSPNQPLPMQGPNATPPIGNTGVINPNLPAPSGIQPSTQPAPPINYGTFNSATNKYALPQGVTAGPQALMHVPYGPELTGLSGYGGLITPNGTPVAMSVWQKNNLDPTSVARYNSYVSDIAGMNPADLAQIGQTETGNKMADLKAPLKFTGYNSQVAAPAGG